MGLFDSLIESDESVELEHDGPLVAAVQGQKAMGALAHNSVLEPVAGVSSADRGIAPARASGGTMTPRGVELLLAARKPVQLDLGLQETFLDCLSQVPNMSMAAISCGVTIGQVRTLRKNDPAFDEAVEMAIACASGAIEQKAFQLAVNGQKKGIYFQGTRFDEETQYLPDLMIRLMAGSDTKYKNKTEISGEININHSWADMIAALGTGNET